MSKNRKGSAQRQSRGKSDLSQLGLFGVPGLDTDVGGLEDGDDDPELEAELMNILASGGGGPKRGSAPKKAKPMPQANLDQMIAESMKDVPSDDSSGEDDPSLLAELHLYTGEKVEEVAAPPPSAPATSDFVPLLTERLNMYKEAEMNAKATGDTAKARRLGRGLRTLEDLLKKARSGAAIDESEIPLPVAVKKPTSPSEAPAEPSPPLGPPPVPPRRSIPNIVVPPAEEEVPPADPSVDLDAISMLKERMEEYKHAAVAAKRAGNLEAAKAHVRLLKQFESVIAGAEAGQPVDLSTMPSSPLPLTPAPTQKSAPSRPAPEPPQPAPELAKPAPEAPQPTTAQVEQSSNDVPQPATVLEALEQRLAVFKKQEEGAKSDGNASKARRMGRIVKQYEDAIKLHNAGKEIPVDELPTPPGFPPIPVDKKPSPPSPAKPEPLLSPGNQQPRPSSPRPVAPPSPTPSSSSSTSVSSKTNTRATRQEKQLAALLQRQKEWKEAAVTAKKAGDMQKAKDCLRQVKGFDPLIEASRSGIPVDLTTIPVPPKDKMENDFEVVNINDCLPGTTNSEIYEQLKADLKKQFKTSMETRLHYKALGDVANANKFEQLAVHTKKDLDRVMVLQEKDDPVPRYHYEMRTFNIIRSGLHIFGKQYARSNTDLNDNDLELSIIQGVNYNVPNPKEIDTYVRYEFPYPQEDPKKDKTPTVYNTNNPEYNCTTIIPFIRSNRACQRVFKRHSIKLEVWSKGGFLRSDTLVGTVNVKLQPLETKCSIHDSFNLMDGRRAVGGKLEVKLRIRHPIQEKEVEEVKEKWLLID